MYMDSENRNVYFVIMCCVCVFCCLILSVIGYVAYNPTTITTETTAPIITTPIPTTTIPTTPIPTTPTPIITTPIPTTQIPLTPTPANGLINIQYMGCYGDQPERVLPLDLGDLSLPACAQAAKNIHSPYFGMQFGSGETSVSQCFAGSPTSTLDDAQKVGVATNCKAITDPTVLSTYPGSYVGDVWSNALYKLL